MQAEAQEKYLARIADALEWQNRVLERIFRPQDGAPAPEAAPSSSPRFLTAKQAAKISGLSVGFFYDNAKSLSFAVRVSPRRLRFDAEGLVAWMREREADPGSGTSSPPKMPSGRRGRVSGDGGAQRAGGLEPKGGAVQGGPGPQNAFWRG